MDSGTGGSSRKVARLARTSSRNDSCGTKIKRVIVCLIYVSLGFAGRRALSTGQTDRLRQIGSLMQSVNQSSRPAHKQSVRQADRQTERGTERQSATQVVRHVL